MGTSKTPLGVGLKEEERDRPLRYLTMIEWDMAVQLR